MILPAEMRFFIKSVSKTENRDVTNLGNCSVQKTHWLFVFGTNLEARKIRQNCRIDKTVVVGESLCDKVSPIICASTCTTIHNTC